MKSGTVLAKRFRFKNLHFVASVGETPNPEAVWWGLDAFGLPVHDNWWQTEAGGIEVIEEADV
jgi:acetyl-CoA synthetase